MWVYPGRMWEHGGLTSAGGNQQIFVMIIIGSGAHIIPTLLVMLAINMIISGIDLIMVVFIIREVIGRIWVKYKVQRKIRKAKMAIWEWIKYRIKSDKAYKSYKKERKKREKNR